MKQFVDIFGDTMSRVGQRQMLPKSVNQRQLGVFAQVTDIASASTSTGSGQQHVVEIDLSSRTGDDLVAAEVYVGIWVDSIADENHLPGGSSIDESQWQLYSPQFNYRLWDGSKDESKLFLYVRNISAGSHTLLIRTRTKYLSQSPEGRGV